MKRDKQRMSSSAKRIAFRHRLRVYVNWAIGIGVALIVILGFFLWVLTWPIACSDLACFNKNLEICAPATIIGGYDEIFEYRILGKEGSSCAVMVTLLQGELNNQDSLVLEGKSMTCKIPLGLVVLPESDISECHGPLKEGLQDLVIEKLHTYIVQNLGKINLELLNVTLGS